MGTTTGIEWTTHTWNPWQGCHKVSSGCKNCYMYREKEQYGQDPTVVVHSKPATFNKPLAWKEPGLVFTCSWSDFFIEEADPWRDEAWDIIRRTPHLTYQVLTKRPELVKDRLPEDWGSGYSNVWLGVTVESDYYVRRLLELTHVQSVLRFVSVEPFIGPLSDDFKDWLVGKHYHWVIAGCESGPNTRPTELDWVRNLRDMCLETDTPFFLKQLWVDGQLIKMPKLDGWVWAQFPTRT